MNHHIDMDAPLVIVRSLVYNHEPYLRQCLDGFVTQKTNFKFEVQVHDDASTDRSKEIILEYAAKFPEIIKPYIEEENQYSKGNNGVWKWGELNSKYIALCEGDDYWIDPLKLQKQVNYMENHPDCGMVYTQAMKYFQETSEYKPGWAAQTDFEDLLTSANKIMTLCTLFRKDLYLRYMDEIDKQNNWLMGDYPLWLYISKNSKVHFLNEITGVYRVLVSSASHTKDLKKMIAFMLSVFDIRCFFANRYGYQNRINGLAHNVINDLFRLSVQKDTNLSKTIFQFAKENGVLSSNVIYKCIFYSMKFGRIYHRRKYPNSATMY